MSSIDNFSDTDLLELFCTQRSEAALALIAARYRRFVFGIAFGYTRDRDSAGEVTDHVFSRLMRDANKIRGRVPIDDWLRRAAADECDPETHN